MSWTDDEIDKLVQDAANAQKVTYKDAYWQEMQAMLDVKPKRKIVGWWWFAPVLLVGALIGGFLYSSNSTETQVSTENELTASNASLNETKQSSETNEGSQNELNSTETELISENEVNNSVNSNLTEFNSSETIKTTNNRQKRNIASSLKSEQTSIDTGNQVSSNSGIESSTNKVSRENQYEPEINEGNEHLPIENQTGDVTIDQLTPFDWSNEIRKETLYPHNDLPIFPRNHLGFYAEVNGGIGQSYQKTASKNELYQLGVNAGLEYHRRNWVFGAGIGLRQQFVNNLELHNRRAYYSFGLVTMDQEMAYDQMIFADLTFHTNYVVGKSAFGISVTPTYLLGARLKYTQTSEEMMGNEQSIQTLEERKSTFVSSENFQKFGFNSGIHYNYLIRNNLLLNVELSTRLGKQLLISNFDGEKRNFPMLIEVGLKHKF